LILVTARKSSAILPINHAGMVAPPPQTFWNRSKLLAFAARFHAQFSDEVIGSPSACALTMLWIALAAL
jgi:hypothetical protein